MLIDIFSSKVQKKAASLLICLVVFSVLRAQEGDSAAYNNEISFNAKHYTLYLSGAPSTPFHQLTYARTKGKCSWRLGLSYKHRGNYRYMDQYTSGYEYLRFPFDVIASTDSSYTSLSASYSHSALVLRPGIERIMGKKKLKSLVGADLLLGILPTEASTYENYYKLDTASGNYYRSISMLTATQRSFLHVAGLSPWYGIKYPFSPRFSMALRFGVEMYYVWGDVAYRDNQGLIYKSRLEYHENYAAGILSDISFIFRF
jgi:hypothetical protein